MITMYGLKTCDTCRKALQWLKQNDIAVTYRDVRADGVSKADVKRWVAAAGLKSVLNTRSTTWRQMSAADQARAESEAGAIALLVEAPTLLKRPIFERGGDILVGFNGATQAALSA